MAIEIKQLVIKSHIIQSDEDEAAVSFSEKEKMMKEMLAECRQLVLSLLREHGER
jgi:hypothetical protein